MQSCGGGTATLRECAKIPFAHLGAEAKLLQIQGGYTAEASLSTIFVRRGCTVNEKEILGTSNSHVAV